MTLPFADQGEALICARVALAIIKRERRRRLPDEVQPRILIGIATASLDGLRLATVRSALLSLSVWITEGRTSAAWLSGVAMRDWYGLPIRRCYFAEYKANRRA